MNRRDFIALTALGLASARAFGQAPAAKPAATALTEKEILREGMPATIANYCEVPDKQPNKICPAWKEKPGRCSDCMFYNKDKSETTFKGKKYARCQLLTDPKKPQFVLDTAYCSTYVKQA
jgi:hypothetical protein